MVLKFKIHTEDKDRKPWDIEVEAEFDTDMIDALGDMMKKPEFKSMMDNLSSHLIPVMLSYFMSKSPSSPIQPTTLTGQRIGVGFPTPPTGVMDAMMGHPISPETMSRLIESLGRPRPPSPDMSQTDIFKDDKVEPTGGYVPKKTPVSNNNKPKTTSVPINKTIKKMVKEIKIEDGSKDLLNKSYEEIKEGEKEKLFEAARKRIEEASKPKEDNDTTDNK